MKNSLFCPNYEENDFFLHISYPLRIGYGSSGLGRIWEMRYLVGRIQPMNENQDQ